MAFFSIIIPCYNQAHFLSDCLNSLLEQNYQDWEAIVVNDGSNDNTSEVTKRYSIKDQRIRLVEKINGGLSSARNHGLQFATGERYIFLDSDDFLYKDCLEIVAIAAKKSDNNELIQYGYTYITEDKERILGHAEAVKKNPLIPEIFKGNLGPCHSICISKKLAHSVGFFDETLKSVEDWDFWMRAIKAGGTQKIIQQSLVYYRYSKSSMSRNPFVMFEALKTVIGRGPKKDFRITIDSSLNKDYDFDTQAVLHDVLLRSLGVGVMQGKIIETLYFFQKESSKSMKEYSPQEFELMCSYMSFRYWYSRTDIEEVFTSIYPDFKSFFKEIGYDNFFIKKALYSIFKRHIFHKNIYCYGKTFGSLFNFIIRNYNEKILLKIY